MYSTCLFCQAQLGTNEVIEHFPVGRRLAFDSATGRLWVVCRACDRWNLSALEERWEAIEECERLFHDTRLRVSTENIGLARLSEGLELVRIGEPQRPELAAWRYGDRLVRRRHRHLVLAGAAGLGVAAVGGLAVAGVIGGGGWIYWMLYSQWEQRQQRRVFHRLDPEASPTGEEVVVRRWHVQGSRLSEGDGRRLLLHIPDVNRKDPRNDGWGKRKYSDQELVLAGDEARGVLSRAMVFVNSKGASRGKVQDAVRLLTEVPSAEDYLQRMARTGAVLGKRKGLERNALTHEGALALEMALHEEAERRALEGELAALERAWKEAEEIAAIADSLTLPSFVENVMQKLRASV